MAQEFTINSSDIENKINQLLPSQGGAQPGVDFSASTMIMPIIDLTEAAEGSVLRADLQTASSFASTNVKAQNSDVLIVNTTGYYKLIFAYGFDAGGGSNNFVRIYIDDGVTEKDVFRHDASAVGGNTNVVGNGDLIAFLSAGKSLRCEGNGSATAIINVSSHQIADISGNLTNPI